MIHTENSFAVLGSPKESRKRKNPSSPNDGSAKKSKKLSPNKPNLPKKPASRESSNLFLNPQAARLFDSLSQLGNATQEEQSKIGSELSSFLNLVGEKLEHITKENKAMKSEISKLKNENISRENKQK